MGYRIMLRILVLAAVSVWLSPLPAQAVPLGFYNITANNPDDAAIGEAQLWVDVLPADSGRVSFTFHNNGPAACSITDVYFDDGSLLGLAEIINGPGVSFSRGASPPNLPGGNTLDPPFVVTRCFLADSDPPVQPNGVNPGEYVVLVFDLLPGKTLADVLQDLISTGLRIGIHVQGYASGGSESFVNTEPLCIDLDEDGFGDPASEWCDYPQLDCDDSDPEVNPHAAEVCNGIDDDCNGLIDDVDADGDGYVAGACGGDDCDDTNFNVNPGVTEGCCDPANCFDRVDNDCDGLIDTQETGCLQWCMGVASAEASAVQTKAAPASRHVNYLTFLFLPAAMVLLLKGLRRKR